MNRYAFIDGREAPEIIENWRKEYNEYRPHSALVYQTPVEFAASVVRRGGLRPTASAPLPRSTKEVILSL